MARDAPSLDPRTRGTCITAAPSATTQSRQILTRSDRVDCQHARSAIDSSIAKKAVLLGDAIPTAHGCRDRACDGHHRHLTLMLTRSLTTAVCVRMKLCRVGRAATAWSQAIARCIDAPKRILRLRLPICLNASQPALADRDCTFVSHIATHTIYTGTDSPQRSRLDQ